METRAYYAKIRQVEETIPEPWVVVISSETDDGGVLGRATEVSRALAAKLIVDGNARLAERVETDKYHSDAEEARKAAERLAQAAKLQFTLVTADGELEAAATGRQAEELGGELWLCSRTDSSATRKSLREYESSILDVARTEELELTPKLQVAQREIGFEHRGLPAAKRIAVSGSGSELTNMAVTETLRHWHAVHSLAVIYRDAYFRHLNDRFREKWAQYSLLAKEAKHRCLTAGVGIVAAPLGAAGPAGLGSGAGRLAFAAQLPARCISAERRRTRARRASPVAVEADSGTLVRVQLASAARGRALGDLRRHRRRQARQTDRIAPGRRKHVVGGRQRHCARRRAAVPRPAARRDRAAGQPDGSGVRNGTSRIVGYARIDAHSDGRARRRSGYPRRAAVQRHGRPGGDAGARSSAQVTSPPTPLKSRVRRATRRSTSTASGS